MNGEEGMENQGHQERAVSDSGYNSDARDAERYRYIKRHMEWRRSGTQLDNDSHGFVGCRFPLLDNFSSAAMLDHNIDRMINGEKDRQHSHGAEVPMRKTHNPTPRNDK